MIPDTMIPAYIETLCEYCHQPATNNDGRGWRCGLHAGETKPAFVYAVTV